MKCQRSVVNHQEEVRIDLLEVNSIRDRLDIGGPVIGVPIIDHQSLYHLVDTLMLTVEEEGDRMVDLHLVRNRLRDGVQGHINLSHYISLACLWLGHSSSWLCLWVCEIGFESRAMTALKLKSKIIQNITCKRVTRRIPKIILYSKTPRD